MNIMNPLHDMKATSTLRIALATLMGAAFLTACQEDELTKTTTAATHAIKVSLCPQPSDDGAASAPAQELTRTMTLPADSLLMHELVSDNLTQPLTLMADQADTRATVVTTENIGTAYGSFGMEGFIDNYTAIPSAELSDFNLTATGQDQYISGGQCTYSSTTRSWTLADGSSNPYPWHLGYQYTFWSYAPKTHAGTFTYGSAGSRGTMTITGYANPIAAKDQKDLLVAYNNRVFGTVSSTTNNDETVDIAFRHALAVVNFDVTALYANYGVDKVEIVNAYSMGDCAVTGSDLADTDVTKAFTWSNQGTKKTFEMTSGFDAGTDPDHFFMIPQTLPSDAKIKITVTKIGESTPVVWETAMPTSTTWKAGKVYTYKLEYVNNLFTVLGEVLTDYQANGTKTYTVNSSANWKMQVTTDGGTTWSDAEANKTYGGWISFDKVAGTGSAEDQTVTATVAAATGTTTINKTEHDAALQNALPKGTADAPYDLSMHTIYGDERTKPVTANCYVIDAPGWYAFPLVYGNAIDWTKNTTTGNNTTAYYPSLSGTNFLGIFQSSEGNITSPYITGATSAYPFWEDVPSYGLIANNGCTLLSQVQAAAKGLTACPCGYVMFQVSKSTLTQGNAVIAVSNSSNILWSWHIWVTDLDLTTRKLVNTKTGRTTPTFSKGVMPHNLGWVDLGTATGYPGKTLRIRFVQVVGGTVKKEIEKNPQRTDYMTESPNGQSTTYQWGRKDPFIRFKDDGSELTTSERSGTGLSFDGGSGAATPISSTIKYPTMFFYKDAWRLGEGKYINLWSATLTATGSGEGYTSAPVKTVYDPCPPGFQVPQMDAFDRWSYNGTDKNGTAGVWSTADTGYKLRTRDDAVEYIFFPATGFRNGDSVYGSASWYKEYSTVTNPKSRYWTAAPNNTSGNAKYCYQLLIDHNAMGVNWAESKASGLSIRPVVETDGVY